MVDSIVLIQSPHPQLGLVPREMAHVRYFASEDDCVTSASQTIMLLYGPLGLWPVFGYINGRVDVFYFVAVLFVCSQRVRLSV